MRNEAHELGEARSRALHAAVARRLCEDPGVLRRARLRVDEWDRDGELSPHYVQAWKALLALDLEDLCKRIVEDDPMMADLRQVSPFAGALDPRERWRLLAAARATGRRL